MKDIFCLPFSCCLLLFVSLLSASMPATAYGNDVSVQAAVEKQNVFVGESFLFQIQVEGSDAAAEPDLSGLIDFHVQPRGGQQNNSESITIVNGKMDRVARRGYIFNYSLTPKRPGNLTIPVLSLIVDGKNYQTRPITITAEKPAETDDFKLRLRLSKTDCYVGEPLVLTATWYIGRDVEGFEFTFPLLDDPRFVVADLKDPTIDRQNAVQIPLGRKSVIGKKSRGVLDGRDYLTVSFQQILLPQQAGSFSLPQATVSCQALVGHHPNRRRDPFADFFDRDFFGRSGGAAYKTFITPSNQPLLTVADLPAKGRPADFTGLVGQYSIATEATPTEVNVGDPITLTILVTGPEYLDQVEIPPLHDSAVLNRDFKIPEEMAAGEVRGRVKSFTQTIRAKHPDVREIPPVTLSYFNPASKKYEQAGSAAIPISVRATRIVTALDAEGRQIEVAKKEIKAFAEGIAYNYEDPAVLKNQEQILLWIYSRWGLLLAVLPPCFFLLLLSGTLVIRQRQKDPAEQKARKAFAEFSRSLRQIEKMSASKTSEAYCRLAEEVRIYLGKKMRMPAGAVTYHDVKERLAGSGVETAVLAELERILNQCEAHRYAGGVSSKVDLQDTLAQSREVISRLERSLNR